MLRCRACGAGGLRVSPIFHHMICAYVGPDYDFAPDPAGCRCPKCQRVLRDEDHDWEVLGSSTLCPACGAEGVLQDEVAPVPDRLAG